MDTSQISHSYIREKVVAVPAGEPITLADIINARAESMRQLEGRVRELEQRLFDVEYRYDCHIDDFHNGGRR